MKAKFPEGTGGLGERKGTGVGQQGSVGIMLPSRGSGHRPWRGAAGGVDSPPGARGTRPGVQSRLCGEGSMEGQPPPGPRMPVGSSLWARAHGQDRGQEVFLSAR